MAQTYGFKELFEEYKFRGTTQVIRSGSDFALDITNFNLENNNFVGVGTDSHGLSGIIGKVTPRNENCAHIQYSQIFTPSHGYSNQKVSFNGTIERKNNNIFLIGSSDVDNEFEADLEMKISLKGDGLAYMGWLDRALEVQFPKELIGSDTSAGNYSADDFKGGRHPPPKR